MKESRNEGESKCENVKMWECFIEN